MQESECNTATGRNTVKTKESAANLVLSALERTAEHAQKTAAVVMDKTSMVTLPVPPTTSGVGEKAQRQDYPPFFEQIRQKTESINNSLDQIEDIMRRCEL